MTEITKKKKILPIIIISAVVLVAVLALIIYILAIAVPKQNYKKAIDTGDRYLSDMDYDNAILAYEEAVELDPKRKEAYLGLADAYIGLTDYDKALDVLKLGYKQTQDDEIKEKMEEVQKMMEEAEQPSEEQGLPLPTASSNNPAPAFSNDSETEPDYQIYMDYVDAVNNGLKNGFTGEDQRKYQFNSILTMSDITKSDGYWGYVKRDIDYDGVDELIICQSINPDPYEDAYDAGWENVICDIYTIKDGELKHILQGGGSATRYYLQENGTIEGISSSGGPRLTIEFMLFTDGEFKTTNKYFREPGDDYYTKSDMNSFKWYTQADRTSPKEEKDEETVLNEIRFLEATGRVKLNITKFDY